MTVHPTFTPSAVAADQLDAITVGRATTFDTLVHRIRGAARDGSRPHTLLVAPRGAGKTHTVHVAVHRSIADSATAKSILPVLIPEDSLAIGSYVDLLVEIARSIDDGLAASAREMRRRKDPIGIEQAINAAAGNRMILLTIENLDRVFDGLGSSGQGALRAWVETSTAVMIFATAPMLFTGVSSRSYPWYGSFIVETLPELTIDDAVVMLGRAARRRGDDTLAAFIESTAGRQRIKVIHRLAGGSPRLWHILSDGIDVESLDALVPAVESLLDRLAPYYQQQLWQLPAGEQRLVVDLARSWERRNVSDLAASLGISNQSAATALGRLTASRWVVSSKADSGDRRASWYDLTEPLLRYHLQYREDRGKPLRLIVEFLRSFYSRDVLLDELANAAPHSPVERHLQRALFEDTTWQFATGALHRPQQLLASLRTWMVPEYAAFNDIAMMLEAVLVAALGISALGISAQRTVPPHLTQLIIDALEVQADAAEPSDKIHASLQVIRRRHWSDDENDALSLFEFLCSVGDDKKLFSLDEDCPALADRHISPPALTLRTLLASLHQVCDEPDVAVALLGEILDDIDGAEVVSESERNVQWLLWLAAIPAARQPVRRRAGSADVGWNLAMLIRSGHIDPRDLDKVMAAFTEDGQSAVAAMIVLTSTRLDLGLPAELDLRRYIGDDLLAAVERVIADDVDSAAAQVNS